MLPLSMADRGEPHTIFKIGGKDEVRRHLAELGLVSLRRSGSAIAVRIVPHRTNPLENSVLFCTLRKLKAGD